MNVLCEMNGLPFGSQSVQQADCAAAVQLTLAGLYDKMVEAFLNFFNGT